MILKGRRILVVEDDQQEIVSIEKQLADLHAEYRIVSTIEKSLNLLASEAFDFLLTDLHIETSAGLDSPDGFKVIEFAKLQQPNIVIVATSSDPRSDIWNHALSVGAHHFFRKPFCKSDELTIAFSLARERKQLIATVFKKSIKGRWQDYANQYPHQVIVDNLTSNKIKALAKRSAMTCVLIGETGTGKEEIAKLLHRFRMAQEGAIPFIAVNCATITSSIAESILFGHKKGSFTGADQTTVGFVAEADGGILFLDEIHALEFKIQQKLLRVLEDGTYNRLGETKIYRSRFQLVAASTKDLDDEVEEGRFLIDLRGRMTGLDIHVPPLRERVSDIPALVALFLSKNNVTIDDKLFVELADKLKTFYWGGNIRQLFKVLDSWIIHCDIQEVPLTINYFPTFKGMFSPERKSKAPDLGEESNNILQPLNEDRDLAVALDYYEKVIIEKAIARHSTIGDAAKALNTPRSTFDARRKKFSIN